MKLVLFDVDGTLVSTGGAGMRAFYRALESAFGVRAAEAELIRPDGKTDPLIAQECLACFGLLDRWCDENRDSLFSCYIDCLEEEMNLAKDRDLIRVLPGVTELLQALSDDPEFCIGLATGNLERGAQIKLQKAGLEGYFRFGGYGSDSEDRTVLTRIGIEKGHRVVSPAPVEASYVIGDTPFDIQHGHAAGARVIAVASSRYSLDDLRRCHPELAVSDLSETETIMSFIRGNSRPDPTGSPPFR
jgi:phosphoglycolate phosphatase